MIALALPYNMMVLLRDGDSQRDGYQFFDESLLLRLARKLIRPYEIA